MKLYLCVTDDKYELPIAVADSQAELARMVGVTCNTVCACLCRLRNGDYESSIYREVEIDDYNFDIYDAADISATVDVSD